MKRAVRAAAAAVALVIGLVAVGAFFGVREAVRADDRWQARCRDAYHGAVQTQTWSGYGFHTNYQGKMVYGYYSTSSTVCRLTSGPNAGVVVDTE
jgi:hypothetical protein